MLLFEHGTEARDTDRLRYRDSGGATNSVGRSAAARDRATDQAALSRLETGKNANPTLETMNRIAAALGNTITCALKDAPKERKKGPLSVV